MAGDVRHDVLKRLILEYQDTNNSILFEQILKRLDKLIVYSIKKFLSGKKLLAQYDAQELYHTAIIGVYHGVEMCRAFESGMIMISRIIGDIEAELNKLYKETIESDIINDIKSVSPKYVEESTVWEALEKEFLHKKLQSLRNSHIITDEAWKILYLRFWEDRTQEEIGKIIGKSQQAISDIFQKTLLVLRKEFKNELD